METTGLDGGQEDHIGLLDSVDDPRPGPGVGGAHENEVVGAWLGAVADPPFLKVDSPT